MCQTNIRLPGLYYKLHLHPFLLTELLPRGFQNHCEYYTKPPPDWVRDFTDVYKSWITALL